MNITALKQLYDQAKLSPQDYDYAIDVLSKLELFSNTNADELGLASLDAFIQWLVEHNLNTVKSFVSMMRYYKLIKRHDLFVRLTQYTGGLDVIDNILINLERQEGLLTKEAVKKDLILPYLGMPPEEVIHFTEAFMLRLTTHISADSLKTILAHNNHGVPESAFMVDITEYEQAPSLEVFLKGMHERSVATLQRHADENKIWFEQIIDQSVVDYVKNDPHLLSAVLENGSLILKKIPYDIKNFLKTTDPLQKRYLSCHCPFAREAILNPSVDINPIWCHCSAGFEKFPFEVILKQKLKVNVLKNVLQGDSECLFEIPLQGIQYK